MRWLVVGIWHGAVIGTDSGSSKQLHRFFHSRGSECPAGSLVRLDGLPDFNYGKTLRVVQGLIEMARETAWSGAHIGDDGLQESTQC